jgi:solute carrier family 24 (sodium/potassium/calcium exchanger), member 6
LTIFAIGNSLADFVANMAVAVSCVWLCTQTVFNYSQVFAPIMGFSACFGGPMLNILLGVGISGTYVMSQTQQPYSLPFSKTLYASTIGLLTLLIATLAFVPWNGYFLPRRWGVFLVISYTIIMGTNVVVELTS